MTDNNGKALREAKACLADTVAMTHTADRLKTALAAPAESDGAVVKDVHTEHCCAEHGCKYGDDDCTVYVGRRRQSFPCEDCSNARPAATAQVPEGWDTKALDVARLFTHANEAQRRARLQCAVLEAMRWAAPAAPKGGMVDEAIRLDARTERELQRAAAELPEGYIIQVCVERHAGWVELKNPDGTTQPIDDDEGSMSAAIEMALELALATGGQP